MSTKSGDGAKKKPSGGNTAEICRRLAQPLADELGLLLWDVRFLKEGATWYLRVFIDRDGGVSINHCESMSRRLDKLLDDADPIQQSYVLEVSSPGIDRELTRPVHFEMCAGMPVTVRFIRPAEDGRRELKGILNGADGSAVSVTAEGRTMTFDKKETSWIRLFDDADADVPADMLEYESDNKSTPGE